MKRITVILTLVLAVFTTSSKAQCGSASFIRSIDNLQKLKATQPSGQNELVLWRLSFVKAEISTLKKVKTGEDLLYLLQVQIPDIFDTITPYFGCDHDAVDSVNNSLDTLSITWTAEMKNKEPLLLQMQKFLVSEERTIPVWDSTKMNFVNRIKLRKSLDSYNEGQICLIISTCAGDDADWELTQKELQLADDKLTVKECPFFKLMAETIEKGFMNPKPTTADE